MGSAYISAMLGSNMAPVVNAPTLASVINPQILQSLSAAMDMPVPPIGDVPSPKPVLVSFQPTPELTSAFNRYIQYTLKKDGESTIGPRAAAMLGIKINDGEKIPTKAVSWEFPEAKYFFVVSLANQADILLVMRRKGFPTKMFLTNPQIELRMALTTERSGDRLLTKDEASNDFNDLVNFWVERARYIPDPLIVKN